MIKKILILITSLTFFSSHTMDIDQPNIDRMGEISNEARRQNSTFIHSLPADRKVYLEGLINYFLAHSQQLTLVQCQKKLTQPDDETHYLKLRCMYFACTAFHPQAADERDLQNKLVNYINPTAQAGETDLEKALLQEAIDKSLETFVVEDLVNNFSSLGKRARSQSDDLADFEIDSSSCSDKKGKKLAQ